MTNEREMKRPGNCCAARLALVFQSSLSAVDLGGIGRDIPREHYAMIALDSTVAPNIGDPVEISQAP